MWVYRNLHTCFAEPRDESIFERKNLIESLSPEEFTVLEYLEVLQWTCEPELIDAVQKYGRMKGVLSRKQILKSLFLLVTNGDIARRFIPTPDRPKGKPNKKQPPAPEPNPYWFQCETR